MRRLALTAFSRTPHFARRWIVRAVAPSYVVGVVCALRHGDDVLLLRQRHDREGWALPGGLLQRGESPREALARELEEELGLRIEVGDEPVRTVVEPHLRRVDIIFEVWLDERPALRVDGVEVVAAAWRPLGEPVDNPATEEALRGLATPGR